MTPAIPRRALFDIGPVNSKERDFKFSEDLRKTATNTSRSTACISGAGCPPKPFNSCGSRRKRLQSSNEEPNSDTIVKYILTVSSNRRTVTNIIWRSLNKNNAIVSSPTPCINGGYEFVYSAKLCYQEGVKVTNGSENASTVIISVTSLLIFCMVDGKICDAMSSCCSSQTCYPCGEKPTDLNNFDALFTR
ncbi:hypothetical protein PR048_015133 [Dryococelus australis]|uniref:Uncharacterized protein n=1 Tax=Dryococelus australis TaxID=614101 RepID=A0ABQ9HG29_9NEOP|nr:hypothetical protein PR048_015133 [Dryococelus australis]